MLLDIEFYILRFDLFQSRFHICGSAFAIQFFRDGVADATEFFLCVRQQIGQGFQTHLLKAHHIVHFILNPIAEIIICQNDIHISDILLQLINLRYRISEVVQLWNRVEPSWEIGKDIKNVFPGILIS